MLYRPGCYYLATNVMQVVRVVNAEEANNGKRVHIVGANKDNANINFYSDASFVQEMTKEQVADYRAKRDAMKVG